MKVHTPFRGRSGARTVAVLSAEGLITKPKNFCQVFFPLFISFTTLVFVISPYRIGKHAAIEISQLSRFLQVWANPKLTNFSILPIPFKKDLLSQKIYTSVYGKNKKSIPLKLKSWYKVDIWHNLSHGKVKNY